MSDEDARGSNGGFNGTKVEVPAWVMAVTYVLSWLFAIALILFQVTGYIVYRPLLIALAIYLLFWPMFQVSPVEMVKRIFPG